MRCRTATLILEPSADLRQRQRERLQQRLTPPLFELVEWLDGPLADDWDGVLFANEVIDALPTPRFAIARRRGVRGARRRRSRWRFVRVAAAGRCVPVATPCAMSSASSERSFDDGYRSEVLPQLPYWIQAVSGGMRRGAMLFVDYGYPRGEYYLPERSDGTLRAYYRHRMHDDPLLWPGLQDLTASVDFTALAEAGVAAGLRFRRLLLAGQLPARQRPGRRARTHRAHRRRSRAASAAARRSSA